MFFLQGLGVIIGLATIFDNVTQEGFEQTSLVVLPDRLLAMQ